jgi:hypothetical protein
MTDNIEPKISDYNSHPTKTTPPAAAKFGVGPQNIQQVREAADARREHSRQLSKKRKS